MDIWSDPAKWIVVGLYACVHITYICFRRSKHPFDFRGLLPIAMVVGFSLTCCVLPFAGVLGTAMSDRTIVSLTPFVCASIMAAGYLDSPIYDKVFRTHFDPLSLDRGIPLWHTSVTGLSRRVEEKYRIWTPGGDPSAISQNLRLERIAPPSAPTIKP